MSSFAEAIQKITAEKKARRKAVYETTPNTDSLPIKVGDKVIFSPWYGGLHIGTVTQITKKVVVIGSFDPYRAKPDQIMPANPENLARLEKIRELEHERVRITSEVLATAYMKQRGNNA